MDCSRYEANRRHEPSLYLKASTKQINDHGLLPGTSGLVMRSSKTSRSAWGHRCQIVALGSRFELDG